MRFTKFCLNITTDQFRVKIGLEIHARILSKTKIFSKAETSSLVNTPSNAPGKVSYFDAALPGTMPIINQRCVEAALLTGLALNCKINSTSYFERKHYFYPDLPSGYQITQQEKPIAFDGTYEYPIYDRKINKLSFKSCKIKRIQMEHDSARTIMMNEQSLIDLNRCGFGLMEIVTEPNFETSIEASSFLYDLTGLLKSLKTCEVNMKEGGFRVDCNISVHKFDKEKNEEEKSPRIELKNVNNLNSIRKAIDYEIDRQIKLKLDNKQDEIKFQTRAYDSITETTYLLRNKDSFYDYRFMPEPNLLPIFAYTVKNDPKILAIDDMKAYEEYKQVILNDKNAVYGISGINVDDIIEMRQKCQIPRDVLNLLIKKYYFKPEQAFLILTMKFDKMIIEMIDKNEDLSKLDARTAVFYYNCLFSEYSEALNINEDYAKVLKIDRLIDYVNLMKSRKINSRIGKILFQLMVKEENLKKLPSELCQENYLFLIEDKDLILKSVVKILDKKENKKLIKDYHYKEKAKERSNANLFRQIQSELNQRADSILTNELLKIELDKRKPQN